VTTAQPRQLDQALRERRGLWAVVRLQVPDHNITSLSESLLALLEHAVGLPDSCGHSEQDSVLAAQRRS